MQPSPIQPGLPAISVGEYSAFGENLQEGLQKIFLETNEDNYAARRVYEKCGFKLEGKHRNEYISADGQVMCRMYYGLLKGELNE